MSRSDELLADQGVWLPDYAEREEPAATPDDHGRMPRKRRKKAATAKRVYREKGDGLTLLIGREHRGIELLQINARWIGCITSWLQAEFIANRKRFFPDNLELKAWVKQFREQNDWLGNLPAATVTATANFLQLWAYQKHRETGKPPDWSKWQNRLHFEKVHYHPERGLRLTGFWDTPDKPRDVWVPVTAVSYNGSLTKRNARKHAKYTKTFLATHFYHIKSATVWLSTLDDGTPVLKCREQHQSRQHTAPAETRCYDREIAGGPDPSNVDCEVLDKVAACFEGTNGRMCSNAIITKLEQMDYKRPIRIINGKDVAAKPLTARSLAWHLRAVGIKPVRIRDGERVAWGYDLRAYLAEMKQFDEALRQSRMDAASDELDALSETDNDATESRISAEKQGRSGSSSVYEVSLTLSKKESSVTSERVSTVLGDNDRFRIQNSIRYNGSRSPNGGMNFEEIAMARLGLAVV